MWHSNITQLLKVWKKENAAFSKRFFKAMEVMLVSSQTFGWYESKKRGNAIKTGEDILENGWNWQI